MSEGAHILVVDDDLRLRDLLRQFLSRHGYLVTTAGHAEAAAEKLSALTFDIIVLDVMMPGENGVEFARRLRQGGSVPILLLTAMGETQDRIAGLPPAPTTIWSSRSSPTSCCCASAPSCAAPRPPRPRRRKCASASSASISAARCCSG